VIDPDFHQLVLVMPLWPAEVRASVTGFLLEEAGVFGFSAVDNAVNSLMRFCLVAAVLVEDDLIGVKSFARVLRRTITGTVFLISTSVFDESSSTSCCSS